jgi:predicted phage terminase large subunit-like protein
MTKPSEYSATPAPEVVDAILRNDLASFLRLAFAEVSPGVTLVWGEYLDLLSARLGRVVSGQCRNLIITMPPRHLKSICVSVALPAFFLGHNPAGQVMAVSYGQELAKKFAEDTRTVMKSEFYTRIFETRLASPRQPPHLLATKAGGIRRATSIEGVATGVGADLLIFDDPQKPGEVLSEAIRRSSNEAYERTFLSRRNNPGICRTVIGMQRLHEDDFVGHVLGLGGDWQVLNLPAIAEMDEAMAYETFMGRFVYKRPEGAALHPERIPESELENIRNSIGEANWASQYMQRPAPAGGGLVNTAMFKRYSDADRAAGFERIVQSWDTANTNGLRSDYSVCTTWGVKEKRIYLLNVFRKRLKMAELLRAIREQDALHAPTEIIIEDHGSGTSAFQLLQNEGFTRLQAFRPRGKKDDRMAGQASLIENGFVYIPEEAHWLPEYLHELSVFPNGKYDDQVDSTSQALEAIGNLEIKSAGFLELIRHENAARSGTNGGRLTPIATTYAIGSMEWAAQQATLAAAVGSEGNSTDGA